MSQYHQGPHFPVSSTPILPLDVNPVRSRGSSTLALNARLPPPPHLSGNSNHSVHALPAAQQLREFPQPASTPSNEPDGPKFHAQYRRGSRDSTTSSSPYAPATALSNAPVGWQSTAPLNLVPYKPFSENLPGNGTSFFYRSPTPSARQRTNQACEKCRDRKTKCSGGRPTCVRCHARGLICEYASETRVRGPSKSRKRNIPVSDGHVAAPAARRMDGRHPYAPKMPTDLQSQSQSAVARKPEGAPCPRSERSWTMSDHSDESNESGDAAAYARDSYVGLNSAPGAAFGFGMPPHENNSMHYPLYRPQTGQHNGTSRDSPMLRVSASMPQLKPLQNNSGKEELKGSSSSVYSTASLNTSFAEFFSSSEDSLHSSRCPSSSSSPSNSNSGPEDQAPLTTGISSKTIKLDTWPLNDPQQNEQKNALDESEDPVYRSKEDITTRDIDGDTPRPSSHQFNPSEWINGDVYSQNSPDYQFPTPATPES